MQALREGDDHLEAPCSPVTVPRAAVAYLSPVDSWKLELHQLIGRVGAVLLSSLAGSCKPGDHA